MLENTEGAIKIGQSIETDNIWLTRRRKSKQYVVDINHVIGALLVLDFE